MAFCCHFESFGNSLEFIAPKFLIALRNTVFSTYRCPTSGRVVTLETGSKTGRACRPSRAEFPVIFSETHVNTGWDPLERPLTEGIPSIDLGPLGDNRP